MPSDIMEIKLIGDRYQLRRKQWKGNIAQISKDDALLEKVRSYTWTYSEGKHPYLNNGILKCSLHKFVLSHVYGEEYVSKMIGAGNIIEHLDNDGLNCTYENLHIISNDLNKAKAFTIDKMRKALEEGKSYPSFITDVYYLHAEGLFQMQVFMNDDIFFNKDSGKTVEMFLCRYQAFKDLYIDWLYLLNSLESRCFEISKFHAQQILAKERPYIKVDESKMNQPFVECDGTWFLNLGATANGRPVSFLNHTGLRKIDIKTK